MEPLKIKFVDFWLDFDPKSNFIVDVLSKKYEIIYTDNPDYLFFSCFGTSHFSYDCVKVLFLGENLVPDFNICDYAIGFDHLSFGDRYLRLPLYVTYKSFNSFYTEKRVNADEILNRKFCSIVVSNTSSADPIRERFFNLLSKYKSVDSGGRALNNIGAPVVDKIDFLSKYKFNIAFENSSVHGYTTEKIMDSMCANSIPIYWGNPMVGFDFNEKSFINGGNFRSLEELVDYVAYLDSSDDEYLAMIRQPWLPDENYLDWDKRLLSFLDTIITKPLADAKYMRKYGASKDYVDKMVLYGKLNSMFRLTSLLNRWRRVKKYIR